MYINWPIVILLVSLSLPGIIIYVPRLIKLLLRANSDDLKKRMTKIAIVHSLVMVFMMSLAGSFLEQTTTLTAPILNPLLQGQAISLNDSSIFLSLAVIIGISVLVYHYIYKKLTKCFVSEHNQKILNQYQLAIQLDGIILYQGVTDEIIARWGLLNVLVFFGILISKPSNPMVIYLAILIGSVIFSMSKIPVLISAGCKVSRPFTYVMMFLYTLQSILFGFIFWQYGLLASMLSHMIFLAGLWFLNNPHKASF
tara:strand:+ start:232 stop:993 length:762 start_codon:yes stop_codon:yes gene_type:complete